MEGDSKLEISLLAIRLAIAAFLLVWVADKFVNPKHSQAVLGSFYAMKDVSPQIVLGLGIAQQLLVLYWPLRSDGNVPAPMAPCWRCIA